MDQAAASYRSTALAAKRRYVAALPRSRDIQDRVLRQIVAANRDAAFGVEHGFRSIDSYSDFVKAVPIRTYGDLEPWIERAAEGAEAMLTAELPIVFHRTSGTTGPAKKIPATRSGVCLAFNNVGAHRATLLEQHPELLDASDATLSLTINPLASTVTPSGLPWCFVSETNWPELGFERHPGAPGGQAPWSCLPADERQRDYFRARLAVESSLRGMLCWYPLCILQFADTLYARASTIVRELHDGCVLGEMLRPPNAVRARQLERLFAASPRPTLREIWPALSIVECWTTSLSRFYLSQLQACVGHEVEIVPCGYGSTESPIGIITNRTNGGSLLDVTCAFFEFLPVDERGLAVRHDQLERDRDYAIVLTTMSGLYRYALEDVVRVTDLIDTVPVLEFRYRQGVSASLGSERLTEEQALEAVGRTLESAKIDVAEASLCPLYLTMPCYRFLLDTPVPVPHELAATLAAALDRHLSKNAIYSVHRLAGLIGPPEVRVLSPGTFAAYRMRRRELGLATLAQQKHRIILAPEDEAAILGLSNDLSSTEGAAS